MAFAELLQDGILLAESIRVTAKWVSEYELRLVQDFDLVPFVEHAPLVPPYKGVVDERAIARQVLQYSNRIAALILEKEEAVSV